jgi:uncharacterized low-complexity protein
MEKKRNLIGGSIVAGAIIAVSGFAANAAGMFSYNNLGTGEEVRTRLLNETGNNGKTLELTCGAKEKTDSTAKKGKDGKCGEGKCGEKKKMDSTSKKGKDGKCGEGKCGESKKKNKN